MGTAFADWTTHKLIKEKKRVVMKEKKPTLAQLIAWHEGAIEALKALQGQCEDKTKWDIKVEHLKKIMSGRLKYYKTQQKKHSKKKNE